MGSKIFSSRRYLFKMAIKKTRLDWLGDVPACRVIFIPSADLRQEDRERRLSGNARGENIFRYRGWRLNYLKYL